MNKLSEKYKRAIANIRKANIESNGNEHPPEETIHLYAMKVLPEAKMKELEAHFDFCWHCTDTLADAEEFQQISEDVEAGRVNVNAKLPSFEELKEMAFGKPAVSSVKKEWKALGQLFEKLVNYFSPELIAVPAGGFASRKLDVIQVQREDGSTEELSLDYGKKEKRVDIYSDNQDLIGRIIRIKTKEGSFVESAFKDRPTVMKSKPVQAVIKTGLNNLRNIESVEII